MILMRNVPAVCDCCGEGIPRAAAQRCPFCRSEFAAASVPGALPLSRCLEIIEGTRDVRDAAEEQLLYPYATAGS